MVFFVIVIFIIIGGILITNTSNEIPAVKMLDKEIEARYLARSIAEAVRLKLKNHPEEFSEALRDYELAIKNGESIPETYKTFISDFATFEAIKKNFGLSDVGNITGYLKSLKRVAIGPPISYGGATYVTDIIELVVEVNYKLDKLDFVNKPRNVVKRLNER